MRNQETHCCCLNAIASRFSGMPFLLSILFIVSKKMDLKWNVVSIVCMQNMLSVICMKNLNKFQTLPSLLKQRDAVLIYSDYMIFVSLGRSGTAWNSWSRWKRGTSCEYILKQLRSLPGVLVGGSHWRARCWIIPDCI